MADPENDDMLALTADIVGAYVSRNSVSAEGVRPLIASVHAALKGLVSGTPSAEPIDAEPQKPAVSIKRSVTPEAIVCLEDGLPFKSLKRHLHTSHDMTPDQYRAKWGLPSDYPIVAPAYAASRSELAKSIGLGRKPGATVTRAAPKKARAPK